MYEELVPKIETCIKALEKYKSADKDAELSAKWAQWRKEYNEKNADAIEPIDFDGYIGKCIDALVKVKASIGYLKNILPAQAAKVIATLSAFNAFAPDAAYKHLLEGLSVAEKKPENEVAETKSQKL